MNICSEHKELYRVDSTCAYCDIIKQEEVIERLRDALQAASDHLDYCGYGDRWESECAVSEGLSDKIETALALVEKEQNDGQEK